jgi:hypothetical protein
MIKMVFIQPLELQTWFVNIFSGSATYFAPIAVFTIIAMSAFFRMTGLTMGFMLFVFLLMFSGFIPFSLLLFISLIGGLLVGYAVSRIVK